MEVGGTSAVKLSALPESTGFMAEKLNERLGRSFSAGDQKIVGWHDIVGDERRKQVNEVGKNKISLINLLSQTRAADNLTDEQKKSLVRRIQRWMKNIRHKYTKNGLDAWQRVLLLKFNESHGISFISRVK